MNILNNYKKLLLTNKTIKSLNYDNLNNLDLSDCCKGYIYTNDDEVVGFVNVDTNENALEDLEVNKDYRQQGIGQELLQVAMQEFNVNKFTTGKHNYPAIRMGQKNGFKVVKSNGIMCYMEKVSALHEVVILNEDKKERTFKCPYCPNKYTRPKLVDHVEKVHSDMIPEGYSAARIVFNHINKKEHGRCVQCGKETSWNEQTWKYNRYCSQKCIDEYKKIRDERMMKTYGKTNLLNDPEHQDKMLKGRKISGTYKFKDGGIRSYCGSYEKKLLEFYDKVLNVRSEDIQTPGPVVEYEYKGETHFWITDLYYIPANLVHDVKDGGSNPNTRDMPDYRAKQEAKEDAISKLNKYNYIRLTDNNFQQLLLILAELKEQLMDESDPQYIIRINESMAMAGMNNPVHNPDVYIAPIMMKNTFIGTALSQDKYFTTNYRVKNGKVVKGTLQDLDDYELECAYKYTGEDTHAKLDKFINAYKNKTNVSNDFIYETFIGGELLSPLQFKCVDCLESYTPVIDDVDRIRSIHESLKYQAQLLKYDNALFVKECNGLQIKEDVKGYFIYNEATKCRSKSFKTIEEIPNNIYNIIKRLEV